MPRTCSVPPCKSGHRGYPEENLTTFAFPSDPVRRNQWLRAIHRDNFVITKHSSVCIKHFHEEHIIRFSTKERNRGKAIPLKIPHLTDDAVPSVFPEQPTYMTTEAPINRRNPEERRTAIVARAEAQFLEWQANDKIENFQDLINNYKSKELFNFSVQIHPDFLYFFKINSTFNNIPHIQCGIKIFNNLKIQTYVGDLPIPSTRFKGMLNKDLQCANWSTFESLLTHVSSLVPSDVSSFESNIEQICGCIERVIEQWTPSLTNNLDDEYCPQLMKLSFLQEQIKLLSRKIPRYSSDLILWACTIFFAFPSAYLMMRDAKVLTLPHPSHLKRLSGDIKCEVGISEDQISYLTTKFKNIKERERVVNVLFDEIHTIPTVHYKGGKIVGLAANNEGATKIQAFMLSAAFGKNVDIAALFPVNNTDAEILKEQTLKVVEELTKIGYETLCLICDNNRMNRAMYRLLGNGEIKKSIPNPFKPNSQIFLLFDPVHLKKSIRNNHLNQKDAYQSFQFPLMDKPSVIASANVKDLKNVYDREKNAILKLAPALSHKVLFPSSLERQNVNIALRFYDEKNVVALEKFAPNGFSGMAEFIKIVTPWWKILNVRSPHSGLHQRDPYQEPIRSPEDNNLNYLQKFADFLKIWHSSDAFQRISVKEAVQKFLANDAANNLLADDAVMTALVDYAVEKTLANNAVKNALADDVLKNALADDVVQIAMADDAIKNTLAETIKNAKTFKTTLHSGKLTEDTYFALLHTTETFIVLCKYVFENFEVEYILFGFFQTDRLEWRFGKFRKMSGCNYHVSVTEVLESERKLKVQSLLRLKSEKYGDFEISDVDTADTEECDTEQDDAGFFACLDASDEIEIDDDQAAVLYYLAGYCSYLLTTHVGNCLDCKKVVASDGKFHIDTSGMKKEVREYLLNLTRGGLKEPTPILNEVVSSVYRVFATLISKDFEDSFLKYPSQRGLLKRLALKKLEIIVDLDEKCKNEECGRTTKNMLTKVSHTLANIFLNNYCKLKNDTVKVSRKRKLDTFVSTKGPQEKKKKKKTNQEKEEKKKKNPCEQQTPQTSLN